MGENRTPRRHSSLDPPSAAGNEEAAAVELDVRQEAVEPGTYTESG